MVLFTNLQLTLLIVAFVALFGYVCTFAVWTADTKTDPAVRRISSMFWKVGVYTLIITIIAVFVKNPWLVVGTAGVVALASFGAFWSLSPASKKYRFAALGQGGTLACIGLVMLSVYVPWAIWGVTVFVTLAVMPAYRFVVSLLVPRRR